MSRAARLLELMQSLRRYRYPVSGMQLAKELSISLRTLYRDIQTLKEQGAVIDGEAGVGFVLRPGFTLPPMMLTQQEIEALVLGSRWIADRADSQLALAARDIIAKVAAVLPAQLRHELESSALLIGPGELIAAGDAELISIRRAINAECKIQITYTVDSDAAVDATYLVWRNHGMRMAQVPVKLDFGYTFVALDPDQHRLRVFTPTAT